MAKNNPVYPYPEGKDERKKALDLHQEAKRKNKPIPHFIRDNNPTDVHYWEGKGNSEIRLIDKNLKNARTAKRDAQKRGQTPTQKTYTDAWGDETGKRLYLDETNKNKAIYKSNPVLTHDIDHIDSLADGGIHGSRNLRSQDLSSNRREGRRRLSPQVKRALMVEGGIETYVRTQGPLLTTGQRDKIVTDFYTGVETPSVVNDNGNGNGNGKNGKNGKVNGKTNGIKNKWIKPTALVTTAVTTASLLPSEAGAHEINTKVEEGEYLDAAVAYGKDLVVGEAKSRTAIKGFQLAQKSLIKQGFKKAIIRQTLKLAGKSLVKKGVAIAAGPFAPIVLAGLILHDAYEIADIITDGKVKEFTKTKAISTSNRKRYRGGQKKQSKETPTNNNSTLSEAI